MRIASLALLSLALMLPASAQVLYEDGPVNGTQDAWTINFGYIVSNTFTLTDNSTVTGFDFYVWEFPGDVLSSVDWQITSGEFGGTTYGSGTASGKNLSDTFLFVNNYGYNIDKATVTGLNVPLADGTYWLNLDNATVPSGDPVFWDENSGIGCHSVGCPSEVSENTVGSIPPESFDVNGTTGTSSVPEPGSIALFGSGVLGVVGVLRRKLL